ncbi:MAG: helix-turn-helix domain-containing protein [Lachnospiraceae bacterium]|nr:helix-turn-helix domain-containing protein [Lachnospiraceae bacterium]
MNEMEAKNESTGQEESAPATYSPVIDYIGPRIQELCEKRHMSRYRLAQRSGVPSISISRYVKGQKYPAVTTLEKLCKGFQISLSEFFEEIGYQPDPALSEEQNHILEIMSGLGEDELKNLITYAEYLSARKDLKTE